MPAAIYTRLSNDKTGAGLAVERQESDCRQLAEQLGLEVGPVFCDNSISAYSGAPRPAYDALLRAISSGEVDAVLTWHQDRLLRRNTDLEDYIKASEPHSVPTYTVKAGLIDLATPAGRAIARTLAAWATYEVDTSTARVKAAKLQAAQAGKWSGGQRPWGYTDGCKAIKDDEAAIYRELVDRVIAGESFRQCAMDLHKRGLRTQHGKEWLALKIRNMLLHARYAGLREHNGALYPAEWPAIITKEKWDQLQLAIREHKRQKGRPGPGRKYLLTGYVYCVCGNRMNSNPRSKKHYNHSRYVCRLRNSNGEVQGCGKITRRIEPVDLLVKEAIIYRLDTDSLADLLNQDDSAAMEAKEILRERDELQGRLKARRYDYDDGLLSRSEYAELKQRSEGAIHELERKLEAATRARTGAHLIPAGQTVAAAWESNDLDWQRQLVGLLVEKVVIHPSDTSKLKKADYYEGFQFRPEDVEICWAV